jgi:hypothetical protein
MSAAALSRVIDLAARGLARAAGRWSRARRTTSSMKATCWGFASLGVTLGGRRFIVMVMPAVVEEKRGK